MQQAHLVVSSVGCGGAGMAKYDGDTQSKRSKGKQQCMPRRRLKSGAKTAPASGVDESTAPSPVEMTRSRVATVVIEESPCSPTPPSSRHKSYSSVSSVGRKLVEKLADEVVEDFMECDLIDPSAQSCNPQEKPKQQQGCIHFTTQADTSSLKKETRGDVQSQQQQQQQPEENKAPHYGDADLVDSAWETQERSFMEKRAFFERQTSSATLAKNLTINRTEEVMKPTTQSSDREEAEEEEEEADADADVYEEDEDSVRTDAAAGHHHHRHEQWNQPRPLRMTDRSKEMCHNSNQLNKPLNHVQSGRSWILDLDVDDSDPQISPLCDLDDREDESSFYMDMEREEMRFFKETCVVRKVFRASSIADDELESSDGSVISLEVTSCPSDGNEDGCHDGKALEWGYSMNLRKERAPAAEVNIK